MPRFFFHLISPGVYDVDDTGCEFPSVEAAYLEAHSAAVEMIGEMLSDRRDPNRFQFEIFDEENRFMVELPFSDILRPQALGGGHLKIQQELQCQLRRSRRLHAEIRAELEKSRLVIESSRETLARAQAR